MIDRQHGDGEGGLQRGVLIKIVDNDLGIGVALELDDHARVFVRFIADALMSVRTFSLTRSAMRSTRVGAIDVVRNLGDDDLLACRL